MTGQPRVVAYCPCCGTRLAPAEREAAVRLARRTSLPPLCPDCARASAKEAARRIRRAASGLFETVRKYVQHVLDVLNDLAASLFDAGDGETTG